MEERDVEPSGTGTLGNRYCLDLQSKKAFFLRGTAREERDLLDGSQHCWCRRTMQAIGPDGELVDPVDCQAGRGCFASIL